MFSLIFTNDVTWHLTCAVSLRYDHPVKISLYYFSASSLVHFRVVIPPCEWRLFASFWEALMGTTESQQLERRSSDMLAHSDFQPELQSSVQVFSQGQFQSWPSLCDTTGCVWEDCLAIFAFLQVFNSEAIKCSGWVFLLGKQMVASLIPVGGKACDIETN